MAIGRALSTNLVRSIAFCWTISKQAIILTWGAGIRPTPSLRCSQVHYPYDSKLCFPQIDGLISSTTGKRLCPGSLSVASVWLRMRGCYLWIGRQGHCGARRRRTRSPGGCWHSAATWVRCGGPSALVGSRWYGSGFRPFSSASSSSSPPRRSPTMSTAISGMATSPTRASVPISSPSLRPNSTTWPFPSVIWPITPGWQAPTCRRRRPCSPKWHGRCHCNPARCNW